MKQCNSVIASRVDGYKSLSRYYAITLLLLVYLNVIDGGWMLYIDFIYIIIYIKYK